MKSRTIAWRVGLIAVLSLELYMSEPYKWFATFAYESMSPHCHYRVDTWTSFFSIDHGFVRVFDTQTGRKIAESDVVFLSGNGQKFWPTKDFGEELMVGMDIVIPLAIEPEEPVGKCAKR